MKRATGSHNSVASHTEVLVDGPFAATTLFWRSRRGELRCSILAKTTYALLPRECPLVEPPLPLRAADLPWDGALERSVRTPSDLVPFKHSPEVMLVGHAYAPGRRPQKRLAPRLVLGDLDAALEVFPPRRFSAENVLEEPSAARMPLAYEHATGGSDSDNPVGVDMGLVDAWGRRAAPSVLPLGLHCDHPGDSVPTAGWGPIAATWPSRARRLRPEDRAWLVDPASAPMPSGFDVRFFQSAPHEHWLSGPIRPDERLVLEHLSPAHERLVTNLDGVVPYASVLGARELRVPLIADTLFIDTDRAVVTLTWRGLVLVDEHAPRLTVAIARTPGRGSMPPPMSPEARAALLAEIETTNIEAPSEGMAGMQLPFAMLEPNVRATVPDFDDDALPFRTPDADLATTKQRPAVRLTPLPAEPAFARAETAPMPSRIDDTLPPIVDAVKNLPFDHHPSPPPPSPRGAPQGASQSAPQPRPSAAAAVPPARPSFAGASAQMPPPPASLGSSHTPSPPPSLGSPPRTPFSPEPSRGEARGWAPPIAPAAEASRGEARGWAPPIAPAAEASRGEARSWGSPVSPGAEPSRSDARGWAQPLASAAEPSREGPSAPAAAGWMSLRAASDAAADRHGSPGKKGDGKGEDDLSGAPWGAPPQGRRHALVDLLVHDAALVARLRRSPAFAKILAASAERPPWTRSDEPLAERGLAERERLDVLRALSLAPPCDLPRVRELIDEAFEDVSQLELPLVVVAGHLKPAHDDLEVLRATVHAGQPLSLTNKALQGALKVLQEAVDSGVAPPGEATAALLRQVEQASGALWSYLQAQVQRTVLEERHFKKRTVLGELRIRAELITPAGETVPAYVPASVAPKLPMLPSFPVVVLGELRPREDAQETHAEAFLVLALGRVVRQAGAPGRAGR